MAAALRQFFQDFARKGGEVPGGHPDIVNGAVQDDLSGMADFSIDEYRPMRVIVVGAGMSGIAAGIRFRQYVPGVDISIYDKNDALGGTWYTNKYPGVACDVPAQCFAYAFENKGDWSACYAPGHEILQYLNDVVDKWQIRPIIKLQHEIVHMQWDEPAGKWIVRIRRPSSSGAGFEEFEDRADVVLNASGGLSRLRWPSIEGLHDFKGTLVHSANWDLGGKNWEEDVEGWQDKSVAVVGIGASALQIVTALQPKVKKLYNVARGQAWVAPPFAVQKIGELLGRDLDATSTTNFQLSKEEQISLRSPEKAWTFRKQIEEAMNTLHTVTIRDSEVQKGARESFTEHMRKSLEKKPWIGEKLIPDFSVGAKRITPAPGYLEALCADNCDFVHGPIKRMTSNSIEFEDGQSISPDVIICATGFDASYRFPFPVIGRDGVSLSSRWTPHPRTYLAACTDGFPNMFFSFGPNSSVGTTTVLGIMEHHVQYAVMATMKLQRERLKWLEVKAEAVADFDKVMDEYFKRTVFSESVSTWYKVGKADGRIVALWPGSSPHCMRALRHPRWEDFNYGRFDKTENRLFWLGDGMSYAEKTLTGDRAWYINPDYVDSPPIPSKFGQPPV
ncbi:FAD/NAD(P)-binding domain-containing protein [Trametopsis cervina]|nr:FAD/NAD(P)-binding domain-containing protein [Trametopsis cervina]